MRFTQIIEFSTKRIDDLNAFFDEWIAASEGERIPHRAVLHADRDREGVYVLTVEFSSHEQGMANSNNPRTQEFASFLGDISDGERTFRNLDVLRHEDL
jgi:quinol monooxygenase YgiN